MKLELAELKCVRLLVRNGCDRRQAEQLIEILSRVDIKNLYSKEESDNMLETTIDRILAEHREKCRQDEEQMERRYERMQAQYDHRQAEFRQANERYLREFAAENQQKIAEQRARSEKEAAEHSAKLEQSREVARKELEQSKEVARKEREAIEQRIDQRARENLRLILSSIIGSALSICGIVVSMVAVLVHHYN